MNDCPDVTRSAGACTCACYDLTRVRYVEVRPSADLANDIQCFWELEGASDGLAEPIFPDGRMEFVVHLGARPRAIGASSAQPEVMAVGQMTTALRLQPSAGLHAIGIRFTPTGARQWLGAPLVEFTDTIQGLDQLDTRTARSIRDAVHAGGALSPSLVGLEAALRNTRKTRWSAPQAIAHAVCVALARDGRVRVEALAASSGLGVRQLERQFLDAVGLSPKRFARTARFQRALQLLRDGQPPADVADRCGFADQAHLAREFRGVAGTAARDVNLAGVAFLHGS